MKTKPTTAIAAACGIFLLLFVVFNYFEFGFIIVVGESMEPALYGGEWFLTQNVPTAGRKPNRGDIVVIARPRRLVVKRVIGLPGETILINKNKIIVKNFHNPGGALLKEAYVKYVWIPTENLTTELTGKKYFVLGDNRTVSLDSRDYGPINEHEINQFVLFLVWPLSKIGPVVVPAY